jgi:hypothetical protein
MKIQDDRSDGIMGQKTKRDAQQQTERRWVEGLLVSAQKREWFGTIRIEIKRGMIDLVASEETLKPPTDKQSL